MLLVDHLGDQTLPYARIRPYSSSNRFVALTVGALIESVRSFPGRLSGSGT